MGLLVDTLLSAEASQREAWSANQFVLMSPVAKKRSVDRPVRIDSTESVTNWGIGTGVMGFLPILNTEA